MFLFHQLHLILIAIALLFFGVEANAQCPTAPGNQTSYGSGSWIGYVYSAVDGSNPPSNVFTTTYRGYITQTETFDQNLGGGSLSGANLCGTYSDQFSIRFKMQKNFTAGYYTFTVGGDDGYRLSLDGGATFPITNFADHSYASTTSSSYYLSGSMNLVLEYYEQGGSSQILFSYTACTSSSTAPTAITGTASICNGTSTTLTATGGTLGASSAYQWGTGSTVGSNIISGQTAASITVSPTTTTTYWVRRVDPSPCSTSTTGATQAVTVTAASTDPTSITGTTTLCQGNSTTLTVNGGTLATGSVYEWGTGTTGSNIISGQTGASITVTPSATTTYWVRRTNTSPCTPYTNAATVSVTVNIPAGNQTSYGSGSWIGYVYAAVDGANPPTNVFTTTYRGYVTQTETFDQNLGGGSLSGANLCGSYADQFSIRFKMQKNFTAGYYTFTVGGDDGYRLSLDGGATFPITNFIDHGYATTTSSSYYLSGSINLVLEYYEQGGSSQVSFSYTSCTNFSSAPTGISGTSSLCVGTGGTTLGATGGYEAPGATYQWGTGAVVGSNIIAGANSPTYYINPTVTTTYWVRRVDGAPCNLTTTGVTQTISVSTASTNPTGITASATTSCSGSNITLTATGGTLATGGSYQWGTGWTVGSNIIAGTTVSISVAPTTSTVYWVRRIDPAPCNTATPGTTVSITVATPSVAPTGISGTLSVCSGSSTTLTATGGTLGTNATYQWGTGSVVGTSPIAGTGASISVSPTSNTTYWVRIIDAAPCSANTAGVTQAVTVNAASVQPTGLTGTTTICNGNSVTLTATGGTVSSAGAYQWGTGWTVGSNIISGQTAATMTVSPTTSTVYWVRIMDGAPCNTPSWTGGRTISITVNDPSTALTSLTAGSTSLCFGSGGTTLTSSGGTAASGSTYQWGTGAIVGTGTLSGQTGSTMYVNPTTTTTYWVRRVDAAPCNTLTAGLTITITAATPSTAPTGVTGTNSICNGTSTTLTATGGVSGTNATYQWGTGSTVGSNIINGETAVSITITPSATTTYWVRRVDAAPCNSSTSGQTRTVTVSNPSTAPASITVTGSSACAGSSFTLSASGGTVASGSTYQWGTGSVVGSNVIAATGPTITVNPTTTTTYWVRRLDISPCSSYTAGITTTVTITAPPGDPATFGSNVWNVYGYSTADITLATAVYAGYYAVNTVSVDTQNGTNSWANTASPSSSAGWSGCTVPADFFTMVLKRQGFPCGSYTVAMSNWDDETQLYINGVSVWSCASWSGASACTGTVGTYTLDSSSTIEIRVREGSGLSNVSLILTNNTTLPTAPTTISGTATVCSGTSTTLTASGGTLGSGVYQWGTGSTVGLNVISGQSAASITVSPSSTTTYWVRRTETLCNTTTVGITQAVTITAGTTAGTLSTPTTTICKNTSPQPITLSGQVGNVVKWQYATNAAFTTGVTDIASTATTLSSATMGSISTTRYYRAVVQNGSCAVAYTPSVEILVPAAVTYSNGVWSSTPTATSSVIIASNLTLNSNLNVCSCQVNAGVTVTVNDGSNLIIQTSLTVDPAATFIVQDKGSIVQVDDNAIDIGKITVIRKTAPMKGFDYTYWSAPVQNWTLNQLSPNTQIDKYYSFNPLINNWVSISGGNAAMAPGRGYIVRAPNGWSATNTTAGVYEGSFNGVPNTGVIPATIQKGAGVLNLIGNPYPSAIDIDLFLTDPANSGIVNGTIYLWTHNTAISTTIPGGAVYNYTADDYAKYNLTGGIKTASTAITGGVAPDGKVASGQGFFIEANTALANGTYTANFKNSMRVAGSNNTFYKVSPTTQTINTIEKNRVWLSITNANGAYNEILVGYVTGATNSFDNLFDGKTMLAGNVLSMYTLDGADNYSIQGRALPFDDSDIVPVGYKTSIASTFTIGIENFDGLFQNQDVYLVDRLTNTTQNLKTGSYTFTSEIGTFNDRFEIHYRNLLGTDNPVVAAENAVVIYPKGRQVNVKSTKTIASVMVYDLLGRTIFTAEKVNAMDFKTTTLTASNQILIVKATLEDGSEATKKVLVN